MKAIEIHMIQNFAPSCINRDDTNSPKDCIFGGVRRARISSQCIKRSIREHFQNSDLLSDQELAKRTLLIKSELHKGLVDSGKTPEEIEKVINYAFDLIKVKFSKDNKTEYLIFFGSAEINGLKDTLIEHWGAILNEKKIPKEVNESIVDSFHGERAADLALFGRMIANAPQLKVDAACQVAHALSTHKTEMEMDFFTAVDDLQQEEESGAGMMGTVEFNSSCFYRYAVIDWEKLKSNLGGDIDLAKKTVEAFLTASYQAIPTGKQNTFAAQNPPSFMMATYREGMPWSLANAFDQPVRAKSDGMVKPSITALDAYWQKLKSINGEKPQTLAWAQIDLSQSLEHLQDPLSSYKEVVNTIVGALS